jgi:NAD(P)-dependent dehydrogenase (short-subunit alcohol dehydrogenase family)
MDLGLGGKTALVTGGSRGIGLAIARVLHEEGARVVICSRSPRHLVAAAKSIGEIIAVPCDVTKPREVRALLKRAGPLDVLVNNGWTTSSGSTGRPRRHGGRRWNRT